MKRTEKHRQQDGEYVVDARDLVNLAEEIGEVLPYAECASRRGRRQLLAARSLHPVDTP
jgi:hypothetical protein